MLIGYARVSTQDQNLDLQRTALEQAGCQKIYEDQMSGARGNALDCSYCLKYCAKATRWLFGSWIGLAGALRTWLSKHPPPLVGDAYWLHWITPPKIPV